MKIEFKDVSFKYDTELILEHFNLTIEDGQMVAILGHNGSGKSTIAKLIMGLLGCDEGEIYINDQLLDEKSVDQLRLKMGIVFQNPDNQFVGVTVKDDIAFGLENRCVEREQMLSLIDKYLDLVSMNDYKDSNPEELSGGQKQRVAIAGILAIDAELIIFDESTSMLDPKGTKEVNSMIKKVKNETNKTIIAITHDIEEASYADRVIVLNKGKVVADGTPKDVLSQGEILEASGLRAPDSISLIHDLNKLNFKNKKEVIDTLWESTFKD